MTAHLAKTLSTWAEGSSRNRTIHRRRDKIIVLIYVHVRLKHEAEWRKGRHAAVYAFRNGKAIEMRIFDDQQEAFEWAGVAP
jgi:predicted Ser/Thr protein kinase